MNLGKISKKKMVLLAIATIPAGLILSVVIYWKVDFDSIDVTSSVYSRIGEERQRDEDIYNNEEVELSFIHPFGADPDITNPQENDGRAPSDKIWSVNVDYLNGADIQLHKLPHDHSFLNWYNSLSQQSIRPSQNITLCTGEAVKYTVTTAANKTPHYITKMTGKDHTIIVEQITSMRHDLESSQAGYDRLIETMTCSI